MGTVPGSSAEAAAPFVGIRVEFDVYLVIITTAAVTARSELIGYHGTPRLMAAQRTGAAAANRRCHNRRVQSSQHFLLRVAHRFFLSI